MKIASAQINAVVGRIQDNLKEHYRIIDRAIKEEVSIIAFPEMSITGYCREEGDELAFTENDKRLDDFKKQSSKGNIILIVGAPIRINNELYIGSFVIYPNECIAVYTKQYLHKGEDLYYSSSMNYNPLIDVEGQLVSLAICADINEKNHPCDAKLSGATIYFPSIFFTDDEMERAHSQLVSYAKTHSMAVMMSNYSGHHCNMEAGGQCAFWSSEGELKGNLGTKDVGMLIASLEKNTWELGTVLM